MSLPEALCFNKNSNVSIIYMLMADCNSPFVLYVSDLVRWRLPTQHSHTGYNHGTHICEKLKTFFALAW